MQILDISSYGRISVIIPVYNAEKTIARCINSMLYQTYENWELLLINDGSTDNSAIICGSYSKIDRRIKLYNKENAGVSSARNYGLQHATGEWVVFIDSDDYVEPNYLKDFFMCSGPITISSIVIQGMIRDSGYSSSPLTFNNSIYEKERVLWGMIDNLLFTFGAPYCKLYNRELLRQSRISFPLEYSYGEDTIFFLRYMQYVDTLFLVSSNNYHYVDAGQNSLSQKNHDVGQLKAYFNDYLDSLFALMNNYHHSADLIVFNKTNINGIIKKILLNMFSNNYQISERKKYFNQIRNIIKDHGYHKISLFALFLLICPMEIWYLFIKLNNRIKK